MTSSKMQKFIKNMQKKFSKNMQIYTQFKITRENCKVTWYNVNIENLIIFMQMFNKHSTM